MNPYAKYKNAKANSWTRIDMLLFIYENVIMSLDNGISILQSEDRSGMIMARIDAQKKILLLTEGLAVDTDPTAGHILNICVFILDQLLMDDVEAWKTSLSLIETLHEGFQAIADEARELERTGKIPQLQL